jgi:hypothetical protein
MLRLCSVAAATITVFAGWSLPSAAAATVVQPVHGHASGSANADVATDEEETGIYTTDGQLGSGTYSFTTDCTGPSDTSTATIERSDGLKLTGTAPSPGCFGGDITVDVASSSRDLASAHLVFTRTIDPPRITTCCLQGLTAFAISGTTVARQRVGYVLLGSGGNTYAFGGVPSHGSKPLGNAVHIELTASGNGYWVLDATGSVDVFGDAAWYGNLDRIRLRAGEMAASLSPTPSGHGYWIFTTQGRAQPFGDAQFFGDMHNVALNGAIAGSVATPTGRGYYMVGADGGVFAFGDAHFYGSMGGTRLNQPVVGMVPNATGTGYWLVAADGGVFAFHAPFRGSLGNIRLNRPVVGIMRYGTGYLLAASDGGIFSFSNRPFFGSLGGAPPASPITGASATG